MIGDSGLYRRSNCGGRTLRIFYFTDARSAALRPDAEEDEKRDDAIRDGSDDQGPWHSDHVGETRYAEAGEGHDADKRQHKNGRNSPAQIIGGPFLDNGAGKTKICGQTE